MVARAHVKHEDGPGGIAETVVETVADPAGAGPGDTAGAAAGSRPYRKRKGEGHVRRDEILTAAQRIFIEDGFEQATIRKIAARAGISPTALYLYFPDKQTILEELCEHAFAKLVQRMDAILAGGGGALDKVRRIMRAYIDFGLEHPDEYRLTFMVKALGRMSVDHRDPGARQPGQPGYSGPQAYARLRDAMADLIAEAGADGQDVDLATEVIWMSGHGLVSLMIGNSPRFLAHKEELVEALIRTQLYGILRR